MGDCAMRKGIAKQFVERFGRVDEIREQGVKVGGVAVLRQRERYIYNLVTKEKYYEKPTMTTLRNSLSEMAKHMQKKRVEGVAMPRIGCGLDLLEWRQVRRLLEEVFKDSDSKIVIYTREEDQVREQQSMETFLNRDRYRDRDRDRDRDHDRDRKRDRDHHRDRGGDTPKKKMKRDHEERKGEKEKYEEEVKEKKGRKRISVEDLKVEVGHGFVTSRPLPDVFLGVTLVMMEGLQRRDTLERFF